MILFLGAYFSLGVLLGATYMWIKAITSGDVSLYYFIVEALLFIGLCIYTYQTRGGVRAAIAALCLTGGVAIGYLAIAIFMLQKP